MGIVAQTNITVFIYGRHKMLLDLERDRVKRPQRVAFDIFEVSPPGVVAAVQALIVMELKGRTDSHI